MVDYGVDMSMTEIAEDQVMKHMGRLCQKRNLQCVGGIEKRPCFHPGERRNPR